jgi:hypothetical protein
MKIGLVVWEKKHVDRSDFPLFGNYLKLRGKK